MTKIYTIGFTKTSAESFFGRLRAAGVQRVVDIRRSNKSQLAGFAKEDDLRYFLDALLGIPYIHRLDLAPTQEIMDAYRKRKGSWAEFERQFLALIAERRIEETVPRELLDGACLVCSEDEPTHCHRRLIAEYLQEKWGDVEIVHL